MLQQLNSKMGAVAIAKPVAPVIREPSFERTIVTPEIARAWLERNEGNRKISRSHVSQLARDMRAGKFPFNGIPIQFDRTGKMINGQHRLLACIEADTDIDVLVVYGLPPEVQETIDIGARGRTAADILKMGGANYATFTAAACRTLLSEKIGDGSFKTTWTVSEVQGVLSRHPKLPASVRHSCTRKIPRGISAANVGFIHYVGSHLLGAPTTADAFMDVLHSGVPSMDGCAAHAYRERVLRAQGRGGAAALLRPESWRLLKAAWNAFTAGRQTQVLRGAREEVIDGLNYEQL